MAKPSLAAVQQEGKRSAHSDKDALRTSSIKKELVLQQHRVQPQGTASSSSCG